MTRTISIIDGKQDKYFFKPSYYTKGAYKNYNYSIYFYIAKVLIFMAEGRIAPLVLNEYLFNLYI